MDSLGLIEGHAHEGVLELVFRGSKIDATAASAMLAGSSLDGRRFEVRANQQEDSLNPAFAQGVMAPGRPVADSPLPGNSVQARETLNAQHRPPTLSAELLEGWPNPFRDAIQVKFKVPQTMGEAFVWSELDQAPQNLDKDAPVPWGGGMPNASVKIYNINGQELITLHDGSVSLGEYTVHWNGADSFGRQVASGTYFCKLQLDEWSVTRRIVYLR